MMKFLSLFLSIHILFLSVAPAFPGIRAAKHECSKMSCCEKESGKQKKDIPQNDGCCNALCNPFMSCCNGSALAVQANHLTTFFCYVPQKFNELTISVCSDFLSDAWHPPKTA